MLHEEDFATRLWHRLNLAQHTPNNWDRTINTCRHAVSTRCWVQGNYLEAECVDVDPVGKSITCRYNKPFRGHSNEFTGREFNVPYDVLVVAVSLPAINFV